MDSVDFESTGSDFSVMFKVVNLFVSITAVSELHNGAI